jgi:uncharacterized tellurite resistance protein B-like protein
MEGEYPRARAEIGEDDPNGARMNQELARCHLLAEILAADGFMTEEERSLLEQYLTRHQLTEEERDHVRHFEGAADAASALRGLSAPERQQVLDELVEAALADGKLTAQETAAVKRIAEALGLAG